MALGLEEVGATARLASALEEVGIPTFAGKITRETGGEQKPWFDILGLQRAHATSQLSVFSLEYDPRFLEGWHGDLPPTHGGIARRDVLARYAAKLEQPREGTLLRDVVALQLALDEGERAQLRKACEALGYAVEGDAASWSAQGPQFRIDVSGSDGPGGLRAIELSLERAVEREPVELGRLRVTFDGDRAFLELRD